MQQSLIQNRKSCKSFVARVGIALGIAGVIAMAPMSNAMAETFYTDYYKRGDTATENRLVTKLDNKVTSYCANRKKSVHLNSITAHTDPKIRTLIKQIVSFSCIKKSSKRK